jgi:site-specific DNA-methyltransferase (cytosine-N4-specific)
VVRSASAIPVGTQFSPALINIEAFIAMVVRHSGDREALIQATFTPAVHKTRTSVPLSPRTARLPLEAAVQYGLLTRRDWEATEVARDLNQLSGAALIQAWGRHVMLHCGGLRVVEAAQEMDAEGLPITGNSISRYLTAHGFTVIEQNTGINSLRGWLELAGVFDSRWDVDKAAKARVCGIAEETIPILAGLDDQQRAFLLALCAINPEGWCKAAEVRSLAEARSGLILDRSSLPNRFLTPLKAAGLLEFDPGGTQSGKSARLRTTPEFNSDVLETFCNVTASTLDPELMAYFRRDPQEIFNDLGSQDTFVKGQALEGLAIHVMRLLGLRFVTWRKRGAETGGAEVDALFDGRFGVAPTRWQIQCKNTPSTRVRLEDVAREVGVAMVSHATHILILANCGITRDARNYAQRAMRSTALTIYLLDKSDFKEIQRSPASLGGILSKLAEDILANNPADSPWSGRQQYSLLVTGGDREVGEASGEAD